MTGIYSLLGLQDGDDTFINTIGQDRIFDAAKTYLSMVDQEMALAFKCFIQGETENWTERYKLPGGGRMQQRGSKAANAAVSATAGWDVGYPLLDYEEPVAEDDTDILYMTVQDVDLALDSIRIRSINALRFDILKRLLNNTNFTFIDKRKGTITVVPLANADSALYPPILGLETETSAHTHYAGANYISSAISNTNNPYITLRSQLEEHFGTPMGFGDIAVFINSAEVGVTEALADYDQVDDTHKLIGANRDSVTGAFPAVPGRIIGRTNGVWVVEWRWIPAGYLVALQLDAAAPLKMRRDPAATGMVRGLHLEAETDIHPLYAQHYRNRYGIGTANRLNGAVLQLVASTTYTIPAAYV